MSEAAIPKASFDEHCRAIGKLCIAWAVLDRKLTDLASIMIGQGPDVTACLFTGTENINPRCEAIAKLALLRPPSPDPAWMNRLTDLVKEIRVGIAPQRNRVIHDEWWVREEGITRIQWGGYVHKEPHKPKSINFARIYQSSTSEIVALIDEVERAQEALSRAVATIGNSRLLGQPPEQFWQ